MPIQTLFLHIVSRHHTFTSQGFMDKNEQQIHKIETVFKLAVRLPDEGSY